MDRGWVTGEATIVAASADKQRLIRLVEDAGTRAEADVVRVQPLIGFT